MMRFSVINKSECAKYDFGHFLLTPDFFLEDGLNNWNMLDRKSSASVSDYFSHVKNTVNEITEPAICYDLTDGLTKFFDKDTCVTDIGSTKKVAKKGDFVISRLRSYLEEMGIVEQKKNTQLFSTEFLVFRQKTGKLSTYTLFALCMTKIVQAIFKQGQHGTEHPRFYDFLLIELPIPDCLLSMDEHIKKTIKQALQLREYSRAKYREAQTILMSELGLNNWQPKHHLAFVKDFSHTKQAERIDAEYYQPKYDKIVNVVKNYSGGWDTLGNLVNLKMQNYQPKEKQEYKYIELANITGNGEITNCIIEKGQDLPTRARRKVSMGDVIVSSIEGSLDSIALIDREYNQALCSTGFYVVDSLVLNSQTLFVLLKSIVGQLQLKKGCGGTILTAINKAEFAKIVLPKIKKNIQTQIQQKVIESSGLREQSRRLLGYANCAVEIAIEEDEQSAINWLERQTQNI